MNISPDNPSHPVSKSNSIASLAVIMNLLMAGLVRVKCSAAFACFSKTVATDPLVHKTFPNRVVTAFIPFSEGEAINSLSHSNFVAPMTPTGLTALSDDDKTTTSTPASFEAVITLVVPATFTLIQASGEISPIGTFFDAAK